VTRLWPCCRGASFFCFFVSSQLKCYSPNGTQANYTEQSATNVLLRSTGTQGAPCPKQQVEQSCPASRAGRPSLAGSTGRPRINSAPFRAQRRGFLCCLRLGPALYRGACGFLLKHVMKAGLTAPDLPVQLPECATARTIPPSTIIVSPLIVAVRLLLCDLEVTWRGVMCSVRSNDC